MATKKKPAVKKKPAPKKSKKPPRKATVALAGDELLIEELGAARLELKRVATQESYARKQIEADLQSERAVNERLRQELAAVHLDLKMALADLEIARTEGLEDGARAQAASRELTAALDAQRRAEHALTTTRDELFGLRRQLDVLKKAP